MMRAVADEWKLERVDRQIGDAMADHAPFELAELQRRREDVAVASDHKLGHDDVECARMMDRKRALDGWNAEGTQCVVRGNQTNERKEIVCGVADRSGCNEHQPRADGAPRQRRPALRARIAEAMRLV